MAYKHFDLAVYCTVQHLAELKDLSDLAAQYDFFARHLQVNKVYLETYRSGRRIEREKMLAVKDFFTARGIRVAGGITPTAATGLMGALCYTNEDHRRLLREMSECTAELFDEFIVDDFFFTNCRCISCLAAKGERDWPEFRLALLREAAAELVVGPAKKVNPGVRAIIKYPNWSDHYHDTGYNLAEQPGVFDLIYTGTETRDPMYTQQHLQPYLSYSLLRYMERVKPGKNGGGWFDPFDCSGNLNHYLSQLNLTLFAMAREITLFCFHALHDTAYVPLAGYALDKADAFLGRLGNPAGLAYYKPFHSAGEDFLQDYLGMLGIPIEPQPDFPAEDRALLLTANAAADPGLLGKMRTFLLRGNTVFITSGLLKALAGKGLEDLAGWRYTDRKLRTRGYCHQTYHCGYLHHYEAAREIILPRIEYATNDSWPILTALGESGDSPILLSAGYGQGRLHLLAIPDDFGDLYHLPPGILRPLRELMAAETGVILDGPGRVGLFAYDNGTFIIHSFLPHRTEVGIKLAQPGKGLVDLATGRVLTSAAADGESFFRTVIEAGAYRVFGVMETQKRTC